LLRRFYDLVDCLIVGESAARVGDVLLEKSKFVDQDSCTTAGLKGKAGDFCLCDSAAILVVRLVGLDDEVE